MMGPANCANLGIAVSSVRPLERHRCPVSQRRDQGSACQVAWCVQDRDDQGEGQEEPERQGIRPEQEWNGRHGSAGSHIGEDAGPSESEAVHQRPPSHRRQQRANPYYRSGEAHLHDAAGRLQDEPWQRDRDHHVAHLRYRVRTEHRVQRGPADHALSTGCFRHRGLI